MNGKLTKKEIEVLEKTNSRKALTYYRNKTNVGEIDNSTHLEYTGPCGETMRLYLRINKGLIEESKFQYEGCPGLACCGSTLCEIVKGKTLKDAKKVTQEDILENLKASPIKDFDCPLLAVKTLEKVIKSYKPNKDKKEV